MIYHTEELVSKIRAEFPELVFASAQLVRNVSDDHTVLILDDEWVFRFPRSWAFKQSFKQEVAMLKELKQHKHVPVPEYVYLSAAQDFGGYRMIKGVELEPEVYSTLTGAERLTLAADLAQLNSALHALPTSLSTPIADDEVWSWTTWYGGKRPFLAEHCPGSLLRDLDIFMGEYDQVQPPQKRLVNGDFVGEHIFYDLEKRMVAGVIDFGDLSVGDPAGDFTYFWSYDDDFPKKMFQSYAFKNEDPNLLERAHTHFVRYELARMVEALEEGALDAFEHHRGIASAHLGR